MLEEIRMEEQMELLKRVALLTKQGKFDWNCEEYNPLGFMNEDKVEEKSAYLCHMFQLSALFKGLPYELEIEEYINVPSGKGNVAVTLTRDVPGDFMKIDAMLSSHSEAYDNCSPEELMVVFKDDPVMLICNAVVPAAAESDAVAETFAWARYINERGISDDLLNDPLTKLGEKLFDERRILDYHRAVFDVQYRRKLLAE